MHPSRRSILLATVGTLAAAVTSACAPSGGAPSPSRPWTPRTPQRIPPELRAADGRFDLTVQAGMTELVPGKPTETWGVNGPLLGPTLRLPRGRRVTMAVSNATSETTTLHWHGMMLPAAMDGGPHQPVEPGGTWSPTWVVRNSASTLWYHPHTHGQTAAQVHRGVAGLIYIDDDGAEDGLPDEYGVDDIPLVLQDRTVAEDGSLEFETVPTFGQMGPEVLVNGTLGAHLELGRTLVRLRLLNGSNARVYHFCFADDRPFAVVGGDLGRLPRPLQTTRLRLGPGERAELLAEFTPGETVRAMTRGGQDVVDAGDLTLLEFRVREDAASSRRIPVEFGDAPPPIEPPDHARVRRFALQGHDEINGASMDMTRIDEVVPAGATEVWEITNTVYAHNFHIHGCEFTILDRDGRPPEPWESGRKDTVHLPAKSAVRLAVQFGDDTSAEHPYMYHCHMLRHEDAGMMGQFVVVPPGDVDSTARTLPTGDHAGH